MLASHSGVTPEDYQTRSGEIPLRNKGTRERGNKERGSRLLASANVDTRGRAVDGDSLVSVGAVIDAGLWASGERHPIVRVGDRAEIPRHVRAAVWFRDRGRCRLCPPGTPLGEWHLDHIKPWSAGGADTTDNLRVLCAEHNRERSNLVIPEERPEIPATWWCSRCYMADEHHWAYPAGEPPICPIHPRPDVAGGGLAINVRCSVQRGYVKAAETSGEWPTWHKRWPGLTTLHVDAFCAHCGLRGRTGWTL